MTQTKVGDYKLCRLEAEFLTGWKGPAGAAFNQVYEFLYESGCIRRDGEMTEKGRKALERYRANVSNAD